MEKLHGKGECGCLVISLDFELMWGNIESWTVEGYGQTNIIHVRDVIDRMLAMFERYQVKATFATVGLIMQEQDGDLLPQILPSYHNSSLSPYGGYMENIGKGNIELYFAQGIIEKLKASPCVEIGTHTYCHYYCWEEGQTKDQFEADIQKAVEVATKHDIQLRSIVFPRNQVPLDYLGICKSHGIICYRGNALKFFNTPKSVFDQYKNRICRLADAYINIGGNTSYKIRYGKDGILNIPASRFLRPYSRRLAFMEGLRFRRIKKEMEYAARHDEVYHLWWHPHNFGANINENFAFLEKILATYQHLHKQYGMRSITMGEVCDELK